MREEQRVVAFDIMSCGYFVCTMSLKLPSDRTINVKEIVEYVYQKRPSLKYKEFTLFFK